MNAKAGILVVAMLLTWLSVGGCPEPVDGIDDGLVSPTGSSTDGGGSEAPAGGDSSGDTSDAGDDSGQSSAGGATDGGGDDGGTDGADDGASVDGGGSDDGSTTDDQGGDDGSTSDDGSGDNGSGGGDGSGDDGQPALPETYGATLNCTTTFWDSLTRATVTDNVTVATSITFDADGVPTRFVVPGYSAGGLEASYALAAEVRSVGDSVTLTHTDGDYEATLIVTVTEVTTDATSGRIAFGLEHAGLGQGGAREETGTGTHVIEYQLFGDTIAYTSDTDYQVRWQYPAIGADTTMSFQCQGSLLLQ